MHYVFLHCFFATSKGWRVELLQKSATDELITLIEKDIGAEKGIEKITFKQAHSYALFKRAVFLLLHLAPELFWKQTFDGLLMHLI